MNENILIVGPSRAGKSTLAKKLNAEFGHYIVNTQVLFYALEKAYPQLGIKKGATSPEEYIRNTEIFAPFIAHYFCNLARHSYVANEAKFVADVEYFDFENILPVMEELPNEFIFIGLVNNASSEELYENIRKHDTKEDWTYNYLDEDLRQFCETYPMINQFYLEFFKKNNFHVYDTSGDRTRIFAEIVNDIRGVQS
jgi:hypothetical protein